MADFLNDIELNSEMAKVHFAENCYTYKNNIKVKFLICLMIFLHSCQMNRTSLFNKFQCTQLIVVVADTETSTTGILSFFNYNNAAQIWNKIIDTIPVNIGRSGFAWGIGLQDLSINTGTVKHEGDNKSPAGIFYLRTAFGYASPSQFTNANWPYKQVDSVTICVDDVNSSYYNSLVDERKIDNLKDWKSGEVMRRNDDLYKWGINIGCNDDPVKRGAGSCVFFHIWKGPGSPTSGCTSMAEENLLKILNEIRSDAKPVVIQGSKEQYLKMKKLYRLP